MTEFLGETIKLTATFKDFLGVETDPDSGTVKVSLYDPDGVAKKIDEAGVKRTGTTSTYDYSYDIAATDKAGFWKHIWKATITKDSVSYKVVQVKFFFVERVQSYLNDMNSNEKGGEKVLAATVVVKEANGAGPTYTTVSVASPSRFCTDDQVNPGASYPCVIPTSAFNYSYWKHFCLDISGTFTKINNVRWYTDGTINWDLGTGGMVMIAKRDSGDHGCPVASYQQAAGVQGTSGYYLKDATNGHAYYKGQTVNPANVTTYVSGSPILIDSTDHTVAEKTKSAVLQVKIDTAGNGAVQGEKADETFTFMYDEIQSY